MTILLMFGVPIELLANLAAFLVAGVQDQLSGSIKNVLLAARANRNANHLRADVSRHYKAHLRTGSISDV